MKKILIIFQMLICISQIALAQKNEQAHQQDTVIKDLSKKSKVLSVWKEFEKKTKHNTYIYSMSEHSFIIRNKKAKYYDMDANYNPQANFMPMPKFRLMDQDSLMKVMAKCISPYLKEKDLTFGNNLDIEFRFNLRGKIEEVYFSYSRSVEIPLEAFEQLESYILEHCYMQFKANAVLDGVNFVQTMRYFPLKKIYAYVFL